MLHAHAGFQVGPIYSRRKCDHHSQKSSGSVSCFRTYCPISFTLDLKCEQHEQEIQNDYRRARGGGLDSDEQEKGALGHKLVLSQLMYKQQVASVLTFKQSINEGLTTS